MVLARIFPILFNFFSDFQCVGHWHSADGLKGFNHRAAPIDKDISTPDSSTRVRSTTVVLASPQKSLCLAYFWREIQTFTGNSTVSESLKPHHVRVFDQGCHLPDQEPIAEFGVKFQGPCHEALIDASSVSAASKYHAFIHPLSSIFVTSSFFISFFFS